MEIQIVSQDFNWQWEQAVLASVLYGALWLDKSHYSRWIKSLILESKYAENWIDYISINNHDNKIQYSFTDVNTIITDLPSRQQRRVFEQKTEDWILSMRFAKKLAMMSETKKWEEVRNYFLDLEEKYKLLLKFEQLVLASHDFSRDITKWLLDCWYKEKYINELNIIDNWLKSVELWPLYKESPKNIYSSFITFTKSTISRPVLYDKLELLWFKRIQIDWYEYFKWIKLWQ